MLESNHEQGAFKLPRITIAHANSPSSTLIMFEEKPRDLAFVPRPSPKHNVETGDPNSSSFSIFKWKAKLGFGCRRVFGVVSGEDGTERDRERGDDENDDEGDGGWLVFLQLSLGRTLWKRLGFDSLLMGFFVDLDWKEGGGVRGGSG